MKTVVQTPVLEAKTSIGKAKFWTGRVVTDGKEHYIQSEAWQVGPAGESKHILSTPSQVTIKNAGKANETRPEQQARSELMGKMQQKLDKGYRMDEAPEAVIKLILNEDEQRNLGTKVAEAVARASKKIDGNLLLPMLAHSLKDKLQHVKFPVFVQPKFDGVRCLYRTDTGPWSRQGNLFIPRVFEHLVFDTKGLTFDGELLLPPQYTFQQTIGAVKKYDAELSPKLLYVVYDLAVEGGVTFRDRWSTLQQIFADAGMPAQVQLCPTESVGNPDAIAAAHALFVERKYEGVIIRLPDGKYTPGHRSSSLLKHKDFIDEEFPIIGFSEGTGKDAGLVIWICKAPAGEFTVRPRGTVQEREKVFDAVVQRAHTVAPKHGERAQYFTYPYQQLTVRYQNLSDEGIPRFPVGISVRDYE